MAEGLECTYCAPLKGRLFLVPHNMMPQTGKAVKATVSHAEARTEAHVHVKAVSGFMQEQ